MLNVSYNRISEDIQKPLPEASRPRIKTDSAIGYEFFNNTGATIKVVSPQNDVVIVRAIRDTFDESKEYRGSFVIRKTIKLGQVNMSQYLRYVESDCYKESDNLKQVTKQWLDLRENNKTGTISFLREPDTNNVKMFGSRDWCEWLVLDYAISLDTIRKNNGRVLHEETAFLLDLDTYTTKHDPHPMSRYSQDFLVPTELFTNTLHKEDAYVGVCYVDEVVGKELFFISAGMIHRVVSRKPTDTPLGLHMDYFVEIDGNLTKQAQVIDIDQAVSDKLFFLTEKEATEHRDGSTTDLLRYKTALVDAENKLKSKELEGQKIQSSEIELGLAEQKFRSEEREKKRKYKRDAERQQREEENRLREDELRLATERTRMITDSLKIIGGALVLSTTVYKLFEKRK